MKLQGRNLSVQMQGEDVKLLLDELRQLGFEIADAEVSKNLFGKTAHRAVIAFQKSQGLTADGVVGENTAKLLTFEIGRLQKPPDGASKPPSGSAINAPPDGALKPPPDGAPKLFVIQGRIRQKDGNPAVGMTVRAFNKDGGTEMLLGESLTDQSGLYKITYAEERFRRLSGRGDGLNMILRVFDPAHAMHQESNVVRITQPVETVDREVSWLPWTQPVQVVDEEQPLTTFLVKGQVRWFDGRQASSFTVLAFDKDLRSEEELGQTVTDQEGYYQIPYSAEQFRRAEKERADLIVRAFESQGSGSVESEIIFNAQPVETVNLVMGGEEYRGPSEYQLLLNEITPLLDGVAITELSEDIRHQDVTFLSGETGIDREKVTHFIVAHRLYGHSELEPEFWYATLREKLFLSAIDAADASRGLENITQLVIKRTVSVSASMVEYGLRQALAHNIIAEQSAGSVEDWLGRYSAFAAQQMLKANGEGELPSLTGVMDISGLAESKREKLAHHYLDARANRQEVIKRLRGDSSFSPDEVNKIETTLTLRDLTLGQAPLLGAISKGVRKPSDLRELAKLRREDWAKMLKENPEADAPDFISGASPDERAKNYAALLTQRFQDAYPTAAFAGGLERALGLKEKLGLEHGEMLANFLNSHPEFELHTTAVEPFINEKAGSAFRDSEDKESVIRELKASQRVFKLAPNFEATNTLLANGVHSAQQVYRMGETKFVRAFADKPGFSEAMARRAYQRAANTHAAVLTLLTELKATENANQVMALASDGEALNDFPNLQNLFGKADICECEHCRSVYSPSAYFADVLMYLGDRDSTTPAVSVKDVLLERRPDIGYLELSCENSNTPLPYIDLACEVLEDQVAPWHLFNLSLALEPLLVKGPVHNDVREAFKNATPSVKLSPAATVSEKIQNKYWVVRDTKETFKVSDESGALEVSVLRQTHGSADELAANPEYVNGPAYGVLEGAKYPLSLPFHLFTEEVRAYLEKANLKRADLMQVFHGKQAPNNPTATDIAAEYFRVSQTEYALITQADTTNQFTYWGETSNATAITEVGKVDVFLQKTGLEYDDILKLLSLQFVNPNNLIKLVHLDSSCDTSQKRLQVLDEMKLDRIHRFLRLWRKLGWQMWEVDLLIMHPTLGTNSIGSNFFDRLKPFVELKGRFPKLTVEQLASFFGPLNTTSKFTESYKQPEPSLYEQLFLNKKLANPIDDKFEVSGVTAPTPTETLDAHLPPILAALGVKQADLAVFRSLKRPANGPAYIDDKLSLENLSFLYRHAQLAKLLKLKATEWQTLLYIAQLNVFQSPQQTLDFVETVERIRASGFSIDELSYVLTSNRAVKPAQSEKNITIFLSALRTELKKIAAEYKVSDLPDDAQALTLTLTALLQKLDRAPEIITGITELMNDQEVYTFHLANPLPADFEFPDSITNDIKIAYDRVNANLSLTGVMTNEIKNTLLTSTDIDVAVRDAEDYKKAIQSLYDEPRNFIKKEMKFFRAPVFSVPLAALPEEINFSAQLPKELSAKIFYDAEQKLLQFTGEMTSDEKTALKNLSLSPADPVNIAYVAAIEALFTLPSTTTFDAKDLWITAADIAALFDNAAPLNVAKNLKSVTAQVYDYLRPVLSEAFAIQQLSESLGLSPASTKKLLTTYQFFGTPATHPLLEDFTSDAFVASTDALTPAAYEELYDACYWLHRVALIIKKLKMSFTDLEWLIRNHATTEVLDLQTLPLAYQETPLPMVASLDKLLNLSDYMQLHRRYSDPALSILGIVEKLINDATYDNSAFSKDVELLTEWNAEDIKYLTDANVLDVAYPAAYRKILNWKRLAKAVGMTVKLNGSAQSVVPLARAVVGEAESSALKQMLRSKYGDEQWLEVSKDIQDKMRERKRESLVAYLLTRPMPADAPTKKWENSNDLYAYYLIDVEMCACQLSSRIVQASAAAQLFVQRSFMGLEPKIRVSAEEDDVWLQWKWMKNYRVWEANRKVFLYPENWIEPELRRDKSSFFKDLENELLQNEINRDNVETAFLNYIEKLDGVAQLEIAGTYYQDDNHTLHVFARTPGGDPHTYYYRQFIDDRRWTPWSKVECDIQGDHLIPLVMEQRLYLLWPEFREVPEDAPTSFTVPNLGTTYTAQKPWKQLRIHLALSEYRNKKWSPKKVSTDYVNGGYYQEQVIDKSKYVFLPLDFTRFPEEVAGQPVPLPGIPTGKFLIFISDSSMDGYQTFELLGCKGYPERFPRETHLRPILTRFDRDAVKYLRNAETDVGDPLVPHNSTIMVSTILNQTPDFFKINYPQYLSYFDKLRFLSEAQANPVKGGAKAVVLEKRIPLTLGTLYNWFYADKGRTFFVRPQYLGPEGEVYFYKEAVALIKNLIELILAGKMEEAGKIYRMFFEGQLQFHLLFQNYYHPFTCLFAKQLYNKGVDGLMSRETQFADNKLDFHQVYQPYTVVNPSYPQEVVDFAPDGSYSQYNWELFFHAPLMIATRLSKDQRFEEAMQWFHYIFDPTGAHDKDPVTGKPATAPQKYWITKKFYQTTDPDYTAQRIENILKMLAKDPANPTPASVKDELVNQVADWRANPFDPHLIAQFRTVAYQKTTVMKYIDNLIAWGDQLFRQDTMESVNEAAQLYILAAEILGPRPRKVAPPQKPAIESFNELEGRFDAFTNATVNFENLVPVLPGDEQPAGPDAPMLPYLLYFCIPQNEKLLGYWDTVADRLYKIRHCLNIEGVFRQLSLFAPPIDPALLVKAVAAGLDIASALSDLSAPLPHYRFSIMLQKANEVTNDVKALGSALLSALEKKDAEALALLRQSHEQKVLEAAKTIREQQIEDAKLALEGLKKSKEVITIRRNFYSSREFMNPGEIAAMALSGGALISQAAGTIADVLAGVMFLIPDFHIGGSGFGGTPHVVAKTGGTSFGKAGERGANGLYQVASLLDRSASIAAAVAGYQRRAEDWQLQTNLANKELEQIDKQIASAELKISMAENELKNHELQIENAKAADEFLHSKYTNQELYQWMAGQISQVYFQSYKLAYDLAKRAEKCYQYELGIENSSYIQFGYWDSLKKGLLSGEKLQYDLRRLDAAYVEQNRREFELTKHISLAVVNPAALLQLKETGTCFFSLPEELFDLDYPGHYFRRIKSVSISLPCVAGPHTTINGTLRLIKNSVRVNTQLNGQYEHNNEDGVFTDDMRFRESHVIAKSISTSNGQNDGGVFDLNFRDERYLPFEGAGAISTWKLELMAEEELRQFDYDSIADVVMHLKYTAREDAGTFKQGAIDHLKTALAAAASQLPLRRLFNLKHEFPTEWHAFFHPASGANKQLALKLRAEHFPFFAQEKEITIRAISVYVKSQAAEEFIVKLEPPLDPPPPTNANQLTLTQTQSFGNLYWGSKTELSIIFDETVTWLMQMKKQSGTFNSIVDDDVEECFMVVEYNV